MWIEIIPPMAIIVAALAGPGYATYWLHHLVLGNHFRRTLKERWERHLYQRDLRLTGNPYNVIGLEGIPDEETDKKK
ncbi:unnamed protein product [Arctia plantaginis]|uniref:NADH dehydrogenase [ubiquinone] 1 alpha subcomplex subunit 1 n=1 Tax=Arctia plantaginis TaxID=874455 RepID=A0A8S1B1E3_ARCPL|nr:unnamed protein product [Arctia plantaginis]CAB3256171.1 unnamed protein product [Arctia plantaginis]